MGGISWAEHQRKDQSQEGFLFQVVKEKLRLDGVHGAFCLNVTCYLQTREQVAVGGLSRVIFKIGF